MKYSICIGISLVIVVAVYAQPVAGYDMSFEHNSYIIRLKEASAPDTTFFQQERRLIFTYKNQPQKRTPYNVSVVFGYENYKVYHSLQSNENGVFFIFYQIPESIVNTKKLEYMYVIDGVWTYDPHNPHKIDKLNNTYISVFRDFPVLSLKELYHPKIVKQPHRLSRKVTFFFVANQYNDIITDSFVYLMGNFNNWDPYMYKMKIQPHNEYIAVDNNVYALSLYLLPGTYQYTFVVNGKQYIDKFNTTVIHSVRENNILYSQIVVE